MTSRTIGDLLLVAVVVLVPLLASRPRRGGHSLRYDAYMGSALWKVRRRHWIARAGYRCERCHGTRDQTGPLTVHHRTYRRLGHERWEDVAVLCWPCHKRVQRGEWVCPSHRLDDSGPVRGWLR